jgi:hypothetical protein
MQTEVKARFEINYYKSACKVILLHCYYLNDIEQVIGR